MSRSEVRVQGMTLPLRFQVDTLEKDGFSDAVARRLRAAKKRTDHVMSLSTHRVVMDARMFDAMQPMIDVEPECSLSVWAEAPDGRRRRIADKVPLGGRDKDRYDKLIRFIR